MCASHHIVLSIQSFFQTQHHLIKITPFIYVYSTIKVLSSMTTAPTRKTFLLKYDKSFVYYLIALIAKGVPMKLEYDMTS